VTSGGYDLTRHFTAWGVSLFRPLGPETDHGVAALDRPRSTLR